MRGYIGSAAYRRDLAEVQIARPTGAPRVYYVRCEATQAVVAGPFALLEAHARARANADAFHGTYAVILPETDDKGVRTYVADVVSLCYPR